MPRSIIIPVKAADIKIKGKAVDTTRKYSTDNCVTSLSIPNIPINGTAHVQINVVHTTEINKANVRLCDA